MNHKHLLKLIHFDEPFLYQIFDSANGFIKNPKQNILTGKNICNLFFENSTRTRLSFEMACLDLGANVYNFNSQISSLSKGESFLDTVQTLEAMGMQALIIRHQQNKLLDQLVADYTPNCSIINAGIGWQSHPTQALLDCLTLYQEFDDFSKLKIAIVGDVYHSRVCRSLLVAFKALKVKQVNLISPQNLISDDLYQLANFDYYDNVQEGIKDVDAIISLRIQFERIDKTQIDVQIEDYHKNFGLTDEKIIQYAKKHCIVMHPGPVNRDIEIDSSVLNSNQSRILKQVHNGVAIRKAVLQYLLT